MLDWIASTLGARRARHAGRIQSLWSGYGELFRVELEDARTVVVKWARPPNGIEVNASLTRKCQSYDVELAFYRDVAERCDDSCRVAKLLAARGSSSQREWVLVLEDLDAAGYAERVDEAQGARLDAALAWLASFHARFLDERVVGLWPIGTYWQLATRRDELAEIEDPELRAAAPAFAEQLTGARFQTIVHGDPKEANFCFGPAGVAAVDFQYTGGGCGMVDVAYLLHGRDDEPADGIDRARLDTYFGQLRRELARSDVDVDALETEWRALYPIARLDFCRFLAGWRPAMWRSDSRGQRFVRAMRGAR